jgi:molybdenum cofactor cytidylyltransferase
VIAGVLLAAGAGKRFGGGKLLHPLSGVPVGVAALRNLKAALPHVVAVIRPGDSELRAALAVEGAFVIECADAHLGMGHTLAAGVAHCAQAAGWVIALGDMPRIAPGTVKAVAQALREGARIVVPMLNRSRGHPVGFSRQFRDQLLALSGDAGARDLLKAHAADVTWLNVQDDGILQDVDTPEDARRIEKRDS